MGALFKGLCIDPHKVPSDFDWGSDCGQDAWVVHSFHSLAFKHQND